MTILVTGASSGIGEAFARRLAADGFPLVLVARRRDRLDALAAELTSAHGVRVDVVPADLGTPDGPSGVKAATDALGLTVSVLVNNAGYGIVGELVGSDRERTLAMVDLNCRAVVDLTLLYTPAMVERHSGAVFVTASVTAYQSVPFMAAYGATKAFDLLFAESLWAEMGPQGVDVLAVSPGYTSTEFAAVSGAPPNPMAMTPAAVVDEALAALGRRPSIVAGRANRALVFVNRLASRRQVGRISRRMNRGYSRRATAA